MTLNMTLETSKTDSWVPKEVINQQPDTASGLKDETDEMLKEQARATHQDSSDTINYYPPEVRFTIYTNAT
jgi:hypothetical protein